MGPAKYPSQTNCLYHITTFCNVADRFKASALGTFAHFSIILISNTTFFIPNYHKMDETVLTLTATNS